MKKILLFALIMSGFLAQAQQKTGLIYDNNVQKRKLPSFSAISVSNAIDLYLTQSNRNEVAVSAVTEEARDRIITEVEGNTLVIRLANEGWRSWKNWSDSKAKAYVSVEELYALTASGACDVRIINIIEASKLKIKLTGASDLKGDLAVGALSVQLSGASEYKGKLKAKSLTMDLSGASDAELDGAADDLVVELSGASDAKLSHFEVKGAKVHASGASSAKLNVSQLLKVEASGASSVEYKGEVVAKEISSTGASSVKHKN